MPIEFDCPNCKNRLRVPDGTAGKPAKCPECGSVATIPSPDAPMHRGFEVSTKDEPSPMSYADDAGANPYADRPAAADAENPYAAPVAGYATSVVTANEGAELRHTRIGITEIFRHTWAVFQPQLGICAGFGVMVIAMYIGLVVIVSPLSIMEQQLMRQGDVQSIILLRLANQGVGLLFQAFLMCISVQFGLNLVRGRRSAFDGVFNIGHCLLPVIGQQLLLMLINLLVVGVFAGIGAAIIFGMGLPWDDPEPMLPVIIPLMAIAVIVSIVIAMIFLLAPYFIVDRKMGVMAAMSASREFMSGNKGAVFVVFLITIVLSVVLIVCTLFIAGLFVIPYFVVLGTVVYLGATGQIMRPDESPGLSKYYG